MLFSVYVVYKLCYMYNPLFLLSFTFKLPNAFDKPRTFGGGEPTKRHSGMQVTSMNCLDVVKTKSDLLLPEWKLVSKLCYGPCFANPTFVGEFPRGDE